MDGAVAVARKNGDWPQIEQDAKALLAQLQRLLRYLALGDVLDGQQDERWLVICLDQPSGVQLHRAQTDVLELMVHRKVADLVVARQHIFEQPSQLGDIPLIVAQFV